MTTATSAAVRCWARKIRKTASSSSGVRSRLGRRRSGAAPSTAWCGSARAAPPGRRRGSAGRCGSARAGCAPARRHGSPRRPGGCGSARAGRRRPAARRSRSRAGSRPRRRARRAPPGSPPGCAPSSCGSRSKPSSRLRRSSSPRSSRSCGEESPCAGSSRSAGSSPAAVSSAGRRPSAVGSSRISGVPVSTWLPAETSSSRTFAANGAYSTVSIFMLSRTSTGAPASTSAPTSTRCRHDERRGGGADDAALVAADPVADAVDLDELDRAVGGGDEPEALATDDQAAGVVVQALELGVDHLGVAAGTDRRRGSGAGRSGRRSPGGPHHAA